MLNFNTQPYYDDFNEDKNFHRILFKPGVAVQARELTQAQSILQDQIGKFGKFVLSDGSNVSGGKYTLDSNVKSLDLQNTGTISTDITEFTGRYVVGQTSKCVGLISYADILNYYINVKSVINGVQNYISGETLYIFTTKDEAYIYLNDASILTQIQYYSATLNADQSQIINNCSGQINSTQFTIPTSVIEVGDEITAAIDNFSISYIVTEVGYNSIFSVNKQLQKDYNNVPLRITKYASRVVLEVNVDSGVYFTNNTFVKSLPQSIVPNSKTQQPSCIIGFEVQETIIDYIDDTSLLDPSQGAYNYTAPGADRYKIYLNLVSKPLINGTFDQTTITSTKFIELIRIKNGIVISDNTDPILGGLQDVLAKQMYDHAGNFIVSPFKIAFNNSNFSHDERKLNCSISSGKAYVFGYPFNASFPTNISLNKAREIDSSEDITTNTYYGNSIRINDVSGSLPIPAVGSKIALHNIPKGSTSATNSILGYGYIRNIDYVDKNNYTAFLYNVSVPQQKMVDVQSIASISNSTGFSANTTLNSAGQTTVIDPTFDRLLFKLAYPNVSEINSIRTTLDLFTTTTVSSNNATISSGAIKNQFPTGLSASLPTEDKNQNFIVITKNESGPYKIGQVVDLADVTIEIKQVTNNNQAVFTFNNGYTGQIDVKYSLVYTQAEKKTKTLHKGQVAKVTTSTYPTGIGYSDITQFSGVFKTTNTSVTYDGEWSSSVTYGNNSVVKYGNRLFSSSKVVNLANIPDPSGENWNLLQDVTTQYKLNNGQTEYMYDFGTVTARTPAAAGIVFVIFDYYSHSTNGEYIAFDSYPVTYNKIPIETINNTIYSLKDYIDFRPRRKDLSNPDTFIFDTYKIPSSTTNTNMTYSMSYYLGRIDKLILTKDRKLSWLNGVSSYKNYIPPKDLVDAMTIATIQFDPYSADLQSIKIKYSKHRRYTMDDIGDLDTRLQNVEYYTSLNLVEKAALSTNIIDEFGTRLKNGFIVDSFTNFNVLDLGENNKNISLDLENNVARPSFKSRNYNVTGSFDVGESSLINKDNLISFNYTELPIITQNQATNYVKINQFDCISYEGDLYLDPQRSVWTEQIGETIQNIDENTAALMNASQIPGLLYDSWNSIYATHPYDVLETASRGVTVNYNNVNYKVSTGRQITKSTEVAVLAASITPKTRSVEIKFNAHGLAPLSRMFIYVNARLVNAYVTPDENPMGVVTSVKILDPGAGYTSGSVTASITTAAATAAVLNLSVAGGVIDTATLSNHGIGYPLGEQLNVVVTGTHANAASISASTVPIKATNLYSNKAGQCSGTLRLPNKSSVLESFDVGELVITICDTPHYDLENAIAVSHATFYSKTSYYKTVVDSIRLPYLSKSGAITTQSLPNQTPMIVVPASTDYMVFSYSEEYPSIRSKSITIPVWLNIQPTADVTVSWLLNASEDISGGSSISANKTTLTFTAANYNVSQDITITYDLGEQPILSDGTKGDNNLPTHIEFYGTSADERYNYGGTAIPLRSWLSKTPIKATASTHLVPYKKYDPKVGPAAEQSPFITVSPITTSNVGGQSFFTVNYGGGHEIGWWTDSTTTYPLTFTATVANTNCAVISHSTYEDYEYSDQFSGKTRVINKSDQQLLQFKYWIYGVAQGSTTVTVTTASASNPNWSISSTSIPVVVGPALLFPDPAIVVHPNAEIKASTGVVLNSPRTTTSEGTMQIIGVSLSKAPANNVTVAITSSKTAGGGEIYKVSDDGLTSVIGTSLLFTPNTWNHMKTVTVRGTTDPVLYHQATVDYNVTLTGSSADTQFNSISTIVPMKNIDKGTTAPAPPPEPPPPKPVSVNFIYQTLRGNAVNEDGIAVEYTIETSNASGKTLYWVITGRGSPATSSADFISTTGSIVINSSNKGTFTITAIADSLTEGNELFRISIYDNSSASGNPLITCDDTVTDSSKTPSVPVPTFVVTSDVDQINEGQSVSFYVQTTLITTGTKMYYRFQSMASTSESRFSNAVNGSFTIGSDGRNVEPIKFTAIENHNTDKSSAPYYSTFKIITSLLEGGPYLNSQISPLIKLFDTSKSDAVAPPPAAYVYPEVTVSYQGTNHTQNNFNGVKNVIFNITLSGAPKAGDTIKVTMSSDNTETGGTISGLSSVSFTASNYLEAQQITMAGAPLSGSDTQGVSYNAVWSAAADLSTTFTANGKIPLINDKYKWTTEVFAITTYSKSYDALINSGATFTPSVTSYGANVTATEGWINFSDKTTTDPVHTVTVVEAASSYVILKITASLRCYHHGTNNDTPGYKPAVAELYGYLGPADSTTICSMGNFNVSVLSAKNVNTQLNWGGKGTIDPAVSATLLGGNFNKTYTEGGQTRIRYGIIISENTKKKAGEGAPGGVGPRMDVEVLVKVNGFYFNMDSASIAVNESIYSSTTSTTYRNDNYDVIGNDPFTYSSSSTKQEVPYNRDALTLQAVHKVLTNSYPTPPDYVFSGDTGADALMNAYNIEVYQKVVDDLTKFINTMKSKNPVYGSPTYLTIAQEQTQLDRYTDILNSFKNLK
jgi:hypothetical protein